MMNREIESVPGWEGGGANLWLEEEKEEEEEEEEGAADDFNPLT